MTNPFATLETALSRCVEETGRLPAVEVRGWFYTTTWRWAPDGSTDRETWPITGWRDRWYHGPRWRAYEDANTTALVAYLGGTAKALPRIEKAIAACYEEAGLVADAVSRIEAMRGVDTEIRAAITDRRKGTGT